MPTQCPIERRYGQAVLCFEERWVENQQCYYPIRVSSFFSPVILYPQRQAQEHTSSWASFRPSFDRLCRFSYAVVWYLYGHVMEGYVFPLQNYDLGDHFCLFGASGA
jgi:uncharacterized protein (DUF2235 family)